jgi:EAL domain-containing protein (putative c-di-GMP-specific phosphodiesterase class I)
MAPVTQSHKWSALGNAITSSVIVESVEAAEQRDFLIGIGFRTFQGCLFSPAVPSEQFEHWIAAAILTQYRLALATIAYQTGATP